MSDHVTSPRAQRTGARLAALGRVVWGALLLTAPRATVARLGARLTSPADRRVARLLGARHAAQGLMTLRHDEAPWPAVGVAVDILHAGSMVAVAVGDRRRAPLALRSAGVATAWAVVGAGTAQSSRRLLVGAAARILRTRSLVRAPIWAFRCRLGFLFGGRLLMLEHIGRRTGRRRYVVLEVVERDGDAYTVAAGFGERAEWLRNLAVAPAARIWVGVRSAVPIEARRLSEEESAALLCRYAQRHPQLWKQFQDVVERTVGAPVADFPSRLSMVRFTVVSSP